MEKTQTSASKDVDIEKLVPTKKAYATAFLALFTSGVLGGLIGFAMMRVFFPGAHKAVEFFGTAVITALIIYGVSVITSLGLQASVEWRARKSDMPSSKRPSRLIK